MSSIRRPQKYNITKKPTNETKVKLCTMAAQSLQIWNGNPLKKTMGRAAKKGKCNNQSIINISHWDSNKEEAQSCRAFWVFLEALIWEWLNGYMLEETVSRFGIPSWRGTCFTHTWNPSIATCYYQFQTQEPMEFLNVVVN